MEVPLFLIEFVIGVAEIAALMFIVWSYRPRRQPPIRIKPEAVQPADPVTEIMFYEIVDRLEESR